MADPALEPDRVVVAEILRSRGNKGEVLARSTTDVPGRLESLREAWLQLPDGIDRPILIEAVWAHGPNIVLKFATVDSIDDADVLAGADLWVPRAERGTLPDGEFFQSDLIGCTVISVVDGSALGKVTNWASYGGSGLLEVETGRGLAMIPFVPAICHDVNIREKVIKADVPEGLLEL